MKRLVVLGAVLAVIVLACGGYGGSGKGYQPPGSGGAGGAGGGSSPPVANTVDWTSAGVNQKALTVAAGATVTFVNQDTVDHQPASNPHPNHTDCPELNAPVLKPTETFVATMGAQAKSCGFHDHLYAGDARFQGTITVTAQPPPAPPPAGGGSGSGGGSPPGY